MSGNDRRDIFERIAERIIANLEQAERDIQEGRKWRMPWVNVHAGNASPVSLHGRLYRGANWWILKLAGYPSMLFGTYKGWKDRGAQVKKGEKGNLVIFWKRLHVSPRSGEEAHGIDANGNPYRRIMYAKGFTVFAAEQVEGFDLGVYLEKQRGKLPSVMERIEDADATVRAYSTREMVPVHHGGNSAFYVPSLDCVHMPRPEAFKSTAGYYSTLFHELAHSTGHARRLKRDLSKRFGSEAYAAEELVAELSAAMTCGALGIETETRVDHARYIAGWLRAIKSEPKAVVTAASHAQKASDLVLGATAPADEVEPNNGETLKSAEG